MYSNYGAVTTIYHRLAHTYTYTLKQTWLPNRDCSRTLRSGSSRTQKGVRELVVYERLRDEHEYCRTSLEMNTVEIGEHVHERIEFVTYKFDILHVQRFNLCVTMFTQILFSFSLNVTHNSLINNIHRIKLCVTF